MRFAHFPFCQRPNTLPNIALSGCLLGKLVRYDGGHKHTPLIADYLAQHANIISLCPEAEAGFGIPRPPMHLVARENNIDAIRTFDGASLTASLKTWSQQKSAQLHTQIEGAILKKRSPSCGINTTPLYDENHNLIGSTSGLFARELQNYKLVLADEDYFIDEKNADDFLLRCLLLKESRTVEESELIKHYQQYAPINHLADWQKLITVLSYPLTF